MSNDTAPATPTSKAPATSTIYSVRELVKEYHTSRISVPVLRGLDLEIGKGEILSIVGLSGVGKSTLLNILGLLDTPTTGSLLYTTRDGTSVDLAALSARERAEIRNREFGFVFQFYHLLPDLSVLENVLLPAMIRYNVGTFRRKKRELTARADELLERVGISERRDFSPTQLSGGERQRTALARALMNEPRILFCDEPTGNLDTSTGERIHELILELNTTTDVAFILVTHDESLAGLAHRRLAMRDGLFV